MKAVGSTQPKEAAEEAKGRARRKKSFKLEQTPEERAQHKQPLLEQAEEELAGDLDLKPCLVDLHHLLCLPPVAMPCLGIK